MKFLIVGLGNMGAEYESTRHNIGFEMVDAVARECGSTFKNEMLGDLSHFRYRSREVYLLKPSTYMNRSGKAIRYWLQKLKVPSENLLVVVDDFQFHFGTVKLHKKGGSGGHNGLKSIEDYLQTSQYPRLRIGIGHRFAKGRQVDYVLGKWSSEELAILPSIISRSVEVIKSFVAVGIQHTMNTFNQKQDLVKSDGANQ
ncbi:MAG: aminoacyl-tRNA hydrolase [Saprospiraceae bacterium]|nr:aminoacyl-tRNA hydrolase [Saprospiraceae bacterium]